MKRKIITIDQDKCTGCGLCVDACHEGAIGLIDGKARLLREDYCDGLGDCLPACPVDAIALQEQETAPYDRAAVEANMKKKAAPAGHGCPGSAARTLGSSQDADPLPCGCPGSAARPLRPEENVSPTAPVGEETSQLRQWPVQIKLVPVKAPYLQGARLLIAADCAAYAYAAFHRRFMAGHITLIGCPKLDEGDYAEKLGRIIGENDIRSVTVVRMEVPCCGGLTAAVTTALRNSGKMIPWRVVTLSADGRIANDTE